MNNDNANNDKSTIDELLDTMEKQGSKMIEMQNKYNELLSNKINFEEEEINQIMLSIALRLIDTKRLLTSYQIEGKSLLASGMKWELDLLEEIFEKCNKIKSFFIEKTQ